MRRILLLSIIIAMCIPLLGNPVDETTAKQLAQNFWKENNIMGVRGDKVFKKRMNDARFVNVAPQCGYSEFYIFNNEDGKGFVIIAADDCVTPILGYSYDNNFAADNLPPNLKGWLDGYAEQIQTAVEMRLTATDEVRADWECLRQGMNLPIKSETGVGPLITTLWNQDYPYNILCPEDPLANGNPTYGHVYAGCAACAMAQILKFWEYPNDAHSVIYHEYEHPVYGLLDANYSYAGGSYYWSFMPNQLTSSSSTNQKQAVASLMYHCGVSVEMDYGPSGSSAYTTAAEIAFRAFFDHNNATLVKKSSYNTDTQWISLLKNELDNGRPVYYAGYGTGGHAFVCDGYNNSNYFWFNWGWGGQANGFFPVNSLTPTTNGYQHNYSNNQEAIIGIEPGGTNNYHLLGLNDDIKLNGYYGNMFWFDTQIQEITTEVYNWGNSVFNGSLCAVVFDREGLYMAESDHINNCQILPMQSSGQLSFTFSESLNILTCKAYVGIFLIENNQYSLVSAYGLHSNARDFYNYYTLSNDMVELYLYSDIEYSPSSIVQNSAINVTANITNGDNVTFNGYYAAALYGLNGELEQILAGLHEGNGLQPGYHYTNPLNFSCPSVTVPAGTYYLTIIQQSEGSDNWYPLLNWEDCVNPEHVNPIRVEVVSPALYTITATANPNNGGTITGQGEYLEGETCTLIATANNGYIFVNWTESGAQVSTNANYTFTVTGNRNLVANFQAQPQQYTISVSANPSNGGNVSGSGTYTQGQSCTVSASANNGYSFVDWTENGTQISTNANYTFTVTGNRNLVANFQAQPQQYTINVSANPSNGGNVTGGGTYNQGQSCTVSATANSGYTFINWTENGTQVSTNANYTFIVTGNRNLVAHFTAQSYVITAIADPTVGGVVTGSGGYNYGETCTLSATPNTGYTFQRWTKNGTQVSTNPTYSFTVTESATYTAHFNAQSYTITVTANPNNAGSVTGGGSYTYGQTCTVSASANNSYAFTNWTENGTQVSTNANYSFTVTSNRNLVANFTQNAHTIHATAGANGTITPSGTVTVAHGANQSFAMIPDSDYEVQEVYIDGNPVGAMSSYTFTNVTADHYIHVTFMHVDAVGENNSNTIKVYPNPTKGMVNLDCHNMVEVKVFNAFGVMVKRQIVEGEDNVQIDLSAFSDGLYLLQATSPTQTTIIRVVKAE